VNPPMTLLNSVDTKVKVFGILSHLSWNFLISKLFSEALYSRSILNILDLKNLHKVMNCGVEVSMLDLIKFYGFSSMISLLYRLSFNISISNCSYFTMVSKAEVLISTRSSILSRSSCCMSIVSKSPSTRTSWFLVLIDAR